MNKNVYPLRTEQSPLKALNEMRVEQLRIAYNVRRETKVEVAPEVQDVTPVVRHPPGAIIAYILLMVIAAFILL